MMVSLPRLGTITQGTVFAGGKAESYISIPVWGLVITARCDTTHDKVPLINYLPVVRVDDWLHRQGGMLALKRARAESMSKFGNLLRQKNLAHSLLEVYEPIELLHAHFPKPTETLSKEDQRKEKDAQVARTVAEECQKLQACISNGDRDPGQVASLLAGSNKFAVAVVRELLSHQLSGYYFIPDIGSLTEMASPNGYVVILREVRNITTLQTQLMVDGVARGDGRITEGEGLCFDPFDFVFPVAEIQSPWIEHLMQLFCGTFGRIGVADHDKTRADLIVSAVVLKEKSK